LIAIEKCRSVVASEAVLSDRDDVAEALINTVECGLRL
jgi:hypothetical protein